MSPLLFKIALSLILFVEWSEAALSDEQKRLVEGFYGRGELTGAMSFAQVRAHFHANPHHLFNYANGNQQQEVHSYVQQLAAAPNPGWSEAADRAAEEAKKKFGGP
ncbi:hypothetical protein DdX_20568 [Ditylenchus destructor]|uniref:Uncharacterized protein n=1 Tax=Ditylenchus destructor TaxID=166010 RepID=A0AAD4MH00_9BILA|nr:hypothetical protein DdX_20568 [Ditylenchus destructor]